MPLPIIHRPRLIELLQTAVQYKVILVTAPPGYGKTTLIRQFTESAAFPAAWHTIEARERDVLSLHTHSLRALSAVFPQLASLPSRRELSATELAAIVTEGLHEQGVTDFFYVLDDVHELMGATACETWLRTLTATMPANGHLVLISHTLPNLPLINMIARREVLAIGQEQLRFDSDEIESIARHSSITVTDAQKDWLNNQLGGWPAGVVLALQPFPHHLESAFSIQDAGPEALFRAMADEMLDRFSPSMQRFLLASSVVTSFTPEICQHGLGLSDSAAYIQEIVAANLFVTRGQGGLIYHPLFRAVLQQRLSTTQPHDWRELHLKAARWFEPKEPESALYHYHAAGYTEQAIAIAERLAQTHFAQGKAEEVLRWREQLAESPLPAPRLNYTCAMIHTDRYQYAQAEHELAEAEHGFDALANQEGLWQVALLRATISNQQGRYADGIHIAQTLVESAHLPDNLRAYALEAAGMGYLYRGEIKTAIQYLEDSLPIHRTINDSYATSQLLQNLEMAYLRSSRFDEAFACLQEIVAIRRAFGSALGLAVALNDLGYQYHQLGLYAQAQQTFEEGLRHANRGGGRRAESYLLWSLADLERDRGAFQQAVVHYNQALALTGGDEPPLRCSILTSLSTLRRWQGHLDEALSLAVEAYKLARRHHLRLEKYRAALSLWAVRALEGQTNRAIPLLHHLAALFNHQHADAEAAQSYGVLALAAFLQQDDTAGADALEQAIAQTRHRFSQHLLLTELFHQSPLRELASHRSLQTVAVGLQALEQAQIEPDTSIEQFSPTIPYNLRVHTLGQEYVERDGLRIENSAWYTARARELFFYLLFMGPSTRTRICLDFWPERSTESVKRNFHTTLFRARQALGEFAIIFQESTELYSLHPSMNVWCDAVEFESIVGTARLMAPRLAHTEDLWRRAYDLYRGDLLSSMDAPWLAARREALQECFVETLIGLGNCAQARLDHMQAVQHYKQVLQIDPYREPVHAHILNCFSQMGQRKQAAKHYAALHNLFEKDLAAPPSDQLRRLARTLLLSG
ncbi:MAG: tetratricopeptide repeat protein [Anaerolineae bacterium]|nr:tetratricopeptide repeat protein [Anaerolineae bacterium]